MDTFLVFSLIALASPLLCDQTRLSYHWLASDDVPEKPLLASRQSLPAVGVKTKLSPRQSSPLSSPRTPDDPAPATVRPAELPVPAPRVQPQLHSQAPAQPPQPAPRARSPNLSPRQPDVRSHSPQVSPRLQELSPRPTVAPRSPSPGLKPPVSPRATKKFETPSIPTVVSTQPPPVSKPRPVVAPKPVRPSSLSSSDSSPVTSPQQPLSPRTPPPVAPKPKRKTPEDPNTPIETEIFASITTSNEKIPGTKNILPGSTHYDSLQSVEKTGWVPGVVSSADINRGEIDVVPDTHTLHEENNCTENVPVVDDSTESVKKTVESTTKDPFESTEILDDLPNDTKVDSSLYTNRSRTFSTSSNASSYNEFKECDVQEDEIPEQVEDEESTVAVTLENKEMDDYEPDFEEVSSDEKGSSQESEKLRSMAASIVADVITNVKESGILDGPSQESVDEPCLPTSPPSVCDMRTEQDDSLPEEEQMTVTSVGTVEAAPPLPSSPPPTEDVYPAAQTFAPPRRDDDQRPSAPSRPPPPIPCEPPPEQAQEAPYRGHLAEVIDLALYPDSDTDSTEKVAVDVVDSLITVTLHASAPVVSENFDDNVVNDLAPIATDSKDMSATQVVASGESRGAADEIEDQSINDVISMYSNLENSINNNDLSVENNNNNNFDIKLEFAADVMVENDSVVATNGDCDSNNLTSCSVSDIQLVTNSNNDLLSDNDSPSIKDKEESDVNGHSDNTVHDNGACNDASDGVTSPRVSERVTCNDDSDGVTSLRVSERLTCNDDSDGVTSPRVSERVKEDRPTESRRPKSVSRVDEFLSQQVELEPGKYSPELDKMIRSTLIVA